MISVVMTIGDFFYVQSNGFDMIYVMSGSIGIVSVKVRKKEEARGKKA
ncbi:MAG: hypothetical protein F6K25_05340 [Okeania sp. SIO2G4]|nr:MULTISPECIES: hypothetical protein [unclassified Okeania]NEP06777.1 hypothetical protein [Okeania sp. SIO4D6]NEP92072.1 hypothetical protein [Okeania sp. SIO2F5]NEQ90179.1 hypothetical protein [Okeania sp. SIO2G4]